MARFRIVEVIAAGKTWWEVECAGRKASGPHATREEAVKAKRRREQKARAAKAKGLEDLLRL